MSRIILENRLAPILVLILLGSIVGYSSNPRTETHATTNYNPEMFGIDEPLASRSIWENFSLEAAFENISSLGVKRLKETIWMELFLKNQTAVNPVNAQVFDSVISKMKAINVTIIGMAQDFPSWMTGIYPVNEDSQIVPSRNVTDGSDYMNFLQRYNESWETLVRRFPGITTWEIGNEYNANSFLHGYNETTHKIFNFTDSMKTNIIVDLLYYGSSGIHHANPNATTVLGGLAEADSKSISAIMISLESIYENIKGRVNDPVTNSTNTNDYFQVACWHPYLFNVRPTIGNWGYPNEEIHQVMLLFGDKNKRVIFSEFGYRDVEDNTPEQVANYLNETFRLAAQSFSPWLETIYWFRLIDPNPSTTSSENPPGYGIIYLNWTWKPAAYSYRNLIRSTIPEYPIAVILPIFIVTTALIAVITYKRRCSPNDGEAVEDQCGSLNR